MSLTQAEAIQMKTDVGVLKASTSQVLKALAESVDAQKENSKLINELVIEMKERDIKDEYRAKELEELKGFIQRVDDNVTKYIADNHDSLEELSRSQENKRNFCKSITSTWGKVFAMLVLAALAYIFNVDLGALK